jgi:acetyl-CoA C-acetyltransferase
MRQDNTPVIVGGACRAYRDIDNYDRTLIDVLDDVSQLAMADSGRARQVWDDIDAIATIEFAMGTQPGLREMFAPRAPAKALLKRWGRDDCACYRSVDGGNVPQFLINHFAESLARGQHRTVLINAGELIATFNAARKRDVDISHWCESPDAANTATVGTDATGITAQELDHGLYPPANGFALIENAIRHQAGRSIPQHQAHLGELFSRYNAVAVADPNAWYRTPRSAAEITSTTGQNRYVAFPYTKYMCAVMSVNMGAALVMTTAGNARRLGVDEDKLIYLNGCADVNDTLYLSERPDLHRAVALQVGADEALAMSALHIEEIEHFDIYGCFPAVVQASCDALGIDPLTRQVTLTGGLPYYGGPGSGYSLHGAVHMAHTLRVQRGTHGMLIAPGWYLSKASVGVYSTRPNEGEWTRRSVDESQRRLDSRVRPRLAVSPEGRGIVASYTVEFDKQGPQRGVVIGRLVNGDRFVANTLRDEALFARMMNEDVIGLSGSVSTDMGRARFDFA